MSVTAGANSASRPRVPRAALVAAGILVLLLTAYMVGKFLHSDFKDAEVWYDAGRRVLTGQTLANLPHYRYPPTFAVLVAPLCALGFAPFYFLWYALNLWFFALSARLARAIILARGERPQSRDYWLPPLLVAAFAIDNLILGQTNILIMLLVYWVFLEDSRGRQWRAGIPLGAAVAIKAFPAPLLVYFLYRLRLRVVLAAVASCAFFLLALPAPVRGFDRNLRELRQWADRVAIPYVSRGQAGDWGQHAFDFGNQSLSAVVHRYLTSVNAQVQAREGPPIYVNIAELTGGQANAVIVGCFVVLIGAFVMVCGRRRPRDARSLAAEYALATVLLVLGSALAWTYFFAMLLLPVAAALRLLRDGDRLRPGTRGLLLAALCGLLVATLLLPNHLARALGAVCWSALLLFAALAAARRGLPDVPPRARLRLASRSPRRTRSPDS